MNETNMNQKKNKPIHEFKVGGVCAAIWRNTITKNNREIEIKSVSVSKRYLSNNQWQSKSSLDINDIPKAILALADAYKKLVVEKSNLGST